MQSVNVHEAKTNLSSLLAEIEKGKSFLICRNGKVVADLVPHKKRKRTREEKKRQEKRAARLFSFSCLGS